MPVFHWRRKKKKILEFDWISLQHYYLYFLIPCDISQESVKILVSVNWNEFPEKVLSIKGTGLEEALCLWKSPRQHRWRTRSKIISVLGIVRWQKTKSKQLSATFLDEKKDSGDHLPTLQALPLWKAFLVACKLAKWLEELNCKIYFSKLNFLAPLWLLVTRKDDNKPEYRRYIPLGKVITINVNNFNLSSSFENSKFQNYIGIISSCQFTFPAWKYYLARQMLLTA